MKNIYLVIIGIVSLLISCCAPAINQSVYQGMPEAEVYQKLGSPYEVTLRTSKTDKKPVKALSYRSGGGYKIVVVKHNKVVGWMNERHPAHASDIMHY